MIRFFLIFALIFLFYSCSKKNEQIITKVQGDSLEEQMVEAYNSGVAALEKGDVLYATKRSCAVIASSRSSFFIRS